MRNETFWDLADFYEEMDKDGQPRVPAKDVDELAIEVWRHNRNSKNHTRREESVADMGLFQYQGISFKGAIARANKLYMILESGVTCAKLQKMIERGEV